MAKRGDEWFPLSQAVVAYDHARHAPLGDVITLDRAIAAAEFEEAAVRGKGATPSLVRGASHAR